MSCGKLWKTFDGAVPRCTPGQETMMHIGGQNLELENHAARNACSACPGDYEDPDRTARSSKADVDDGDTEADYESGAEESWG